MQCKILITFFHAAFVTLLCVKHMKVVRKICIRLRVNHMVRLDVPRPCRGLIVSLVSQFYRDPLIVIVIVIVLFVASMITAT